MRKNAYILCYIYILKEQTLLLNTKNSFQLCFQFGNVFSTFSPITFPHKVFQRRRVWCIDQRGGLNFLLSLSFLKFVDTFERRQTYKLENRAKIKWCGVVRQTILSFKHFFFIKNEQQHREKMPPSSLWLLQCF